MSHGAERLPDPASLTPLIESMREERLDIVSTEGRPITVVAELGGGGSKSVYDIIIGNRHYALALPNIVDDVETVLEKWSAVLQEPMKTERVRRIGLPVNTICEILPVQVNEVAFPALLMARYQDLPYEVRDAKNPNTSIRKTPVLRGQSLDMQSLTNVLGGVLSDLSTMIGNGVQVMSDSVNLCIDQGQPRIFLNDLGSATFERVSTGDLPEYAETYSRWAVGAMLNALSEPEYQANKRFFDRELGSDALGGLYQALSQEILRNLGYS